MKKWSASIYTWRQTDDWRYAHFYRDVLERHRRRVGEKHPVIAEPVIRDGLELYQNSMPPEHWQRACAKTILAACLIAQGKPDEAKPLLEQSLAVLQKSRGPDDKHTRRAQQLLESLLVGQ